MVDASNSFAQSSRLSFHQLLIWLFCKILLTRLEIELTKITEMDSSWSHGKSRWQLRQHPAALGKVSAKAVSAWAPKRVKISSPLSASILAWALGWGEGHKKGSLLVARVRWGSGLIYLQSVNDGTSKGNAIWTSKSEQKQDTFSPLSSSSVSLLSWTLKTKGEVIWHIPSPYIYI